MSSERDTKLPPPPALPHDLEFLMTEGVGVPSGVRKVLRHEFDNDRDTEIQ